MFSTPSETCIPICPHLIDWMVFYAAFNNISVISRQQLTLFMFSWVSPVLGWDLKCLAQGHSHEKTQRIQCGLNPGPLDYQSNTLPLSRAWPFVNTYDIISLFAAESEEPKTCIRGKVLRSERRVLPVKPLIMPPQ